MAFTLPIDPEKDAASRRIHETVTLHLLAYTDKWANVGKWCAFALKDGRSDGVLYDSKDDAVRSMKSRSKDYCYLKLTPDGITVRDAWHFLKVNRNPFIQTDAPEYAVNPYIFPQFSNLTAEQRAAIRRHEGGK